MSNNVLLISDYHKMPRKDWLKKIARRGFELWPTSHRQRSRWSHQTKELIDTGRHAWLTGGYNIQEKRA